MILTISPSSVAHIKTFSTSFAPVSSATECLKKKLRNKTVVTEKVMNWSSGREERMASAPPSCATISALGTQAWFAKASSG